MDSIKNVKKQWLNSLVFLDNSIVNSVIVVILLLYSTTIFENINAFIGNLYKFSIVKLIVILLIVYVSPKDTTIAILLAISYVVSLNYSTKEHFNSSSNVVISQITSSESSPSLYSSTVSPSSSKQSASMDIPMLSSYTYPSESIESFQGLPFQNKVDTSEFNKSNKNVTSNCMNNYVAKHESLNDVCEPISGINNSLNAQGLNSPEGYGSCDNGSPL